MNGVVKRIKCQLKRYGVWLSVLCLIGLFSALLPFHQSASAFSMDPATYFDYSYSFALSKTNIAQGEAFSVTVSGEATCKADLPIAVSRVDIVARVVARNQDPSLKP